jgi:hypothetical protein
MSNYDSLINTIKNLSHVERNTTVKALDDSNDPIYQKSLDDDVELALRGKRLSN